LIGFGKSQVPQEVMKLYVQSGEETIRLKGFYEDESHVILSITNPNFQMDEPE